MAKKREQGFNATVSEYRAIMESIKRGAFSPVYMLYGEEPYFIDKISDAIVDGALSEDERDFNLEVVYGNEVNANTVYDLSRSYPMMSERRVVVVREAAQMSDLAKLERYADSPLSTTILVLCHKGKSIDKRLTLYKKMSKVGICFDSVVARDYEIKGFLSDLVAEHKFTIDVKAKELLVEHLGCDMMKIDNEIVKLTNAMPIGEKSITCEHIERFIGISKEYNMFELTDAIMVRDSEKIFRIARYFEANPKSAPLVMVLPSIFRLFVSLFSVGIMMNESRRKGTPLPDKFTIAKQANIASHFFVDKYLSAARIYTPARSLAIMGVIRQYDMKSKGIGSSNVSEAELLRELLLKVINI